MSLSNTSIAEIKQLFVDFPVGRSLRNRQPFSNKQAAAINTLRKFKTPKEIEKMLDISVYRIHKMVLYARHNEKQDVMQKNKVVPVKAETHPRATF